MTEFPFKRRDLLRVTGAGLLGTAGVAQSTSPGDELWSVQTDANVRSSPTVVDETVFVGSGDGFPSGGVSALAASDGSEKWTFQTDEGVESSPAVVDETVFIGESRNGTAYALDASDGSTKWQAQPSEAFRSSPTVADGTVFVGGYAEVYALDASDGSENWRFQTGGIVHIASPTVVDGTVFVGSNAVPYAGGNPTVYALDASDGSEQWRFEIGGYCQSSPTVADGTVFIGSNDNNVYALDASNGSKEWTFQTNNLVQSSPTVVDGTVFVGSYDATVYALDASDGSEQWRFETGDPIVSSPTVVGGTVFVGSNDTNVYALDASDGSEQWRFETGGAVRSSPTVVDGTVFVGSNDTNVYALEAGVSGASEGSRVNLGTLGHNNAFAENGPTPPGGGGSGGGELDLSVQAGTAPPGGTYTLTYQITNTGSTTIGDGDDNSPAVVAGFPGVANEGGIPDGGAVDGGGWYAWTIDPGETLEANLEVELPDDIDPGEYEFTAVARTTRAEEDREYDQASGTVTVTVEEPEFDPKVHGFGFENYDTPDLPGFGETLAFVNDVLIAELRNLEGGDIGRGSPGFTIALAGIVYTAQETGLTNGHCLGMVFTAREYYNTGIPADQLESYTPSAEEINGVTIQTPPETAADLVDNPENTPALNPVEVAIDNRQQTQAFDSTHVLRYLAGVFAPEPEPEDEDEDDVGLINEAEVLTAVKQQTDAGKTAPLSLPKTIESSHVVLAYDVTVALPENETAIENATVVDVSVYDPNDPLSEVQALTFSRSTADDNFLMSTYQFGSTGSKKAIYLEEVDPDYQFFTGGAATDGFATALSEGLGSFLSVGVMSPVTVSVTRPDGRSLREVPVSAEELTQQTDTDYEEFHVGLGVSPGEYEIELTGTDTGEYTVEVTGATTDGGQINDSFTKEISAEETQTLTATVPDQDGESGTVTPPDSDPDPDTDTEIDVTRQVSSTEVSPGGEVTLTTEVSGVSGSDSVSITSSYDPPLNSAPTGSVAVDDGALSPSNIDADASPTGSTLTVSNLDTTTDSGSVTVTVTETLSVAEEAGVTHSLTGSVTTGETTVEVDPVSVSVRADGSTSVVDEYDTNNDGTISITELGRGGADFASGELSITELGKLGAAFASSSSSGSSSGS